jgi:ribosomal protein L7/L12
VDLHSATGPRVEARLVFYVCDRCRHTELRAEGDWFQQGTRRDATGADVQTDAAGTPPFEATATLPPQSVPTTVSLVLVEVGTNAHEVSVLIQELMNIGPGAARSRVELLPSTLARMLSPQRAEQIKRRLEGVGATCEIKKS